MYIIIRHINIFANRLKAKMEQQELELNDSNLSILHHTNDSEVRNCITAQEIRLKNDFSCFLSASETKIFDCKQLHIPL
jgi:hypothetical protein